MSPLESMMNGMTADDNLWSQVVETLHGQLWWSWRTVEISESMKNGALISSDMKDSTVRPFNYWRVLLIPIDSSVKALAPSDSSEKKRLQRRFIQRRSWMEYAVNADNQLNPDF